MEKNIGRREPDEARSNLAQDHHRSGDAAEAEAVPTALPPALVRIVEEPIDVAALLGSVSGPEMGALAVFLGTVRGATGGRWVLFLEYEAYAPMALSVMREIAGTLAREAGPCRVAMVHRTGRLEIGEISIAIAVASPHRRVALAACAEAIERVKKTVPIWKKEHFEGGAVWVEGDPSAPGSPAGDRTPPPGAEER